MGKYRSSLEIVRDILRAAVQGAGKTHIMYQCNLNYKLLKRYLTDLKSAQLLRVEPPHRYRITAKGTQFLRRFQDYIDHVQQVDRATNKVHQLKENLEHMVTNPG